MNVAEGLGGSSCPPNPTAPRRGTKNRPLLNIPGITRSALPPPGSMEKRKVALGWGGEGEGVLSGRSQQIPKCPREGFTDWAARLTGAASQGSSGLAQCPSSPENLEKTPREVSWWHAPGRSRKRLGRYRRREYLPTAVLSPVRSRGVRVMGWIRRDRI